MKKIYFNKPQRLTQLIGANTTVIVAGRRTGKTDSIAAPFVLRNMQRMVGSTGGPESWMSGNFQKIWHFKKNNVNLQSEINGPIAQLVRAPDS